MSVTDTLLAPMQGAEHREVGGVQLDTVAAGHSRVKRVIYPVGFRWSKNMKPIVGTDRCMHAHVGFLARGQIHMEFADGWVVGDEPAVVIEFDFGSDTVRSLGMPEEHSHGA